VGWLLLAGSALTAVAADKPEGKPRHNPMLHQQGSRLVDEQGRPVQLRGVSVGGWLVWEGWIFGRGILTPQATIVTRLGQVAGSRRTEQFRTEIYDNFIVEADIEKIAEAGFNCVRVPFHYRLFDDDRGWRLLDRVLGWCDRHRLYAVLDLQMVPGSTLGMLEREPIWTSEESRNRMIELWKAIALRYCRRKNIAGYDLIGEPLPPSGKALVGVYQQLIRAIREVDRDHLIIIEGSKFATDFSMFDKPLDGNQVYSFHMYTWFGDDRRKKMTEYLSLARRHDVPLWVGEFGENTYAMIDSTVAMYAQCPEIAGWSFWTWKKAANNFPGLATIRVPHDWARVMDWVASFWGGNPPSAATVTNGMKEFLGAMKLKNCDYDKRMEQALLRSRQ
jgi:hypothetical protein